MFDSFAGFTQFDGFIVFLVSLRVFICFKVVVCKVLIVFRLLFWLAGWVTFDVFLSHHRFSWLLYVGVSRIFFVLIVLPGFGVLHAFDGFVRFAGFAGFDSLFVFCNLSCLEGFDWLT